MTDVHRALQLVSYLDETAMNIAQVVGDDELYDYDILVKLLSDRFDPASRVLTPLPMPSRNFAVSAIHRARRSSARS